MSTRLNCGVSILLVTLTACGGGGGGSSPAPGPTILALNLNDTFTGTLTGDGSGIWSGGDGPDGGSADGGGAAGDGEFVKVSMRFPSAGAPTGTLTWTILRSQYGLVNTTGNLSIQKDTTGIGGYKVTAVNGSAAAVRANQTNFFVSKTGQLTGSLPLPINGVKDTLFNGIRFKDATSTPTDMSDYAGTYSYGVFAADVGNGANQSVGIGNLRLNADGTGRFCGDGFSWSANCVDGLDIVATFDDAANRNLVRIRAATTQSVPIGAGAATGMDTLIVLRKFGASGVSFTGDVLATRGALSSRTGSMYASRQGANPANPADQIGAWSYTARSIQNPVPFGTAMIAIANVAGVIKGNIGQFPADCPFPASKISTLTAGPVNGVVTATRPIPFPGEGPGYSVLMDTDLAMIVTPNSELGFARRYSSDPTKAPCQPF